MQIKMGANKYEQVGIYQKIVTVKFNFWYIICHLITFLKYEVYGQQNCLDNCLKIGYIFGKQKPKLVNLDL